MNDRLGTILGAALLVSAAACDGGSGKSDVPPPPPTSGRSNAVTAKSGAAPATTTAGVHVAPPQVAPLRQLCSGQSPKPPPKGNPKAVGSPGVEAPPVPVPFGVGKWTWVNFWAAWCGPCKEEMPRLVGWKDKLAAAGVLIDFAFVSLDDDERQLSRFLEGQPKGGVKASYWLPEGENRSSWMAALGVKDPPELPLQALVAPSGQVACVIQGAVEDRDYPSVSTFLGAKKP